MVPQQGYASPRTGIGLMVSQPGVDRNEDAKAVGSLGVQHAATGSPHLIETEAIENRQIPADAEIRLGRRGRAFKS
jgi:hypothetical protein